MRPPGARRLLLLGWLAWLAAAAAAAPAPASATVKVTAVIDGTSLHVVDSWHFTKRLRLRCIDAPEPAQPFGPEAKKMLEALVPVGTEIKLGRVDYDFFSGRNLAEIYIPTRWGLTNVNRLLVSKGMAFVYCHYMEHCDPDAYFEAEQAARESCLGVWSVRGGQMRPWTYRYMDKNNGRTPPWNDECPPLPHEDVVHEGEVCSTRAPTVVNATASPTVRATRTPTRSLAPTSPDDRPDLGEDLTPHGGVNPATPPPTPLTPPGGSNSGPSSAAAGVSAVLFFAGLAVGAVVGAGAVPAYRYYQARRGLSVSAASRLQYAELTGPLT